MAIRIGFWALVPALGVAGAAAAFGSRGATSALPNEVPVVSAPAPLPTSADVHGGLGALPPGHPPIGGAASAVMPPRWSDPPAITWQMPSSWSEAKSPSSIRLATYRATRAPGDDDDAELSVSRAGGSTDANIERWVGQFDDAGKDERKERRVNGLKVTTVEVGGTYLGGMPSMTGGPSKVTKHPNYRLLGAVVETDAGSYFFKLTGPAATVRAAHAAFDAMIDGIKPAR